MLFNLLSRSTLAVCALALGLAFLPFGQPLAQNDGRYRTLDSVQPSETSGKIEVLEFFAYTCPHCKAMEPLVDKWSVSLLGDVTLTRVPVAFNANMADLQKLYYTLESMDRLDLHSAVFQAIHDERTALFTEDEIVEWAEEDRKSVV